MLNVIHARRSYRGPYAPTPVPRADLTTIMEAGLAAPSGCNKQTTSLIAVDDPDLLAQLQALFHPQATDPAPAMICVLTQRIIAYADRCFAVQDYSAAIENMLLTIEALGYRSCWYEGRVTSPSRIGQQMAELLHVPEEYELVCVLPIGIATAEVNPPEKLPFGDRAWFNGFQQE